MSGLVVPEDITFRALDDEPGGTVLAKLFASYWPAYRRWMRGDGASMDIKNAARLRARMPELFPVYEHLLEAFGGDDEIGAFLTLYAPPRVVRGCSQLVLDDDGPVLLRSYDHHPALVDDLVLRSSWLGRRTLAVSDCLWGALDGINEDGLAVALAFGGRNAIGPGFAAPLVVRYVLETCATVEDAKEAIARIPVYMPYTFVVADSSGAFVTAYSGPDMAARFVTRRASTNHQAAVDWAAYCQYTQSEERLRELESILGEPVSAPGALASFLRPPLWRTDYAHASGTLYVSEYRTIERAMTLHWPGKSERFALDDFRERTVTVMLPKEFDDQPKSTA